MTQSEVNYLITGVDNKLGIPKFFSTLCGPEKITFVWTGSGNPITVLATEWMNHATLLL